MPPAVALPTARQAATTRVDWPPAKMVRTWQYYALVFLFIGSAQSGLLVISEATPLLKKSAASVPFLVANAWLLASVGGFVNAAGRVGTGLYADRIGRSRAYLINGVVSAGCLFAMPAVMASGNLTLLFLAVCVAFWQYGGGLALMPAFTADFFGPKNLGTNYGLVFLGWGVAFLMPQAAGYIKDAAGGSLDLAFFVSGGLLVAAVLVSQLLTRPKVQGELEDSTPRV